MMTGRAIADRARFGSAVVGAFWLATLAVLGMACSDEEATPLPRCNDGDSLILVAQSLPTAELLPCFATLPPGWDVATVAIDDEGTTIRLDHDRAGPGAAILHFTTGCGPDRAILSDDHRRATGLVTGSSSTDAGPPLGRFGFDEGCVELRDELGAMASELEDSLRFVDRGPVEDLLHQRFGADHA
jgi:hypothetical protein